MKSALITGIAGQDGVYLARYLCELGYRVTGTVLDRERARAVLQTYLPDVEVHELDIRDSEGLRATLFAERPDEIYNLASWSSVGRSWSDPRQVTAVNGTAVLNLMEVLRGLREEVGYEPKFCQASSSEMFGLVRDLPQDENYPHHPRSPYAVAKSFAHHTAVSYRESYGMFVANAILFNHESPIRPASFVTRKITTAVAAISLGRQDSLTLGRLDIRRDWGFAGDYVKGLHLVLQQEEPSDFNIATGAAHSLDDFLRVAFEAAGISEYRDRIRSDPGLLRPADVPETRGDARRARAVLGWEPEVSFEELVSGMVAADLERLRTGVQESVEYLKLNPTHLGATE